MSSESVHWDKQVVSQITAMGVPWETSMKIVGIIAEHRQIADRQGFERGYEEGHKEGYSSGYSEAWYDVE